VARGWPQIRLSAPYAYVRICILPYVGRCFGITIVKGITLSKLSKILMLIATLVPPVYMALFFAVVIGPFATRSKEPALFRHFGLIFGAHLGVMLLTVALLALYIIFIFRTDRVKLELKALWAVVLFLGGPIAMPIFWYLHIWPTSPSKNGSAVLSGGA
jgi:hypothetical protein